ncbi:protein kinase domain-containing protein [Nocardia wallacei]|uniref:protein kinase domain-containing protein n=1 Tax=Nocardia wallacei TaxID=480035 RepID=UPI0024585643|nr:serine/threonine-protein kinase [Nocardia wallacei]
MRHDAGERRFGRYRLDRLLGSGGTGLVWLAHDTLEQREVALKVLAAAPVDVSHRQRFTREARLISQLRSPYLPRVHAFGEIDNRLYLAMDYLPGSTLATLLSVGPLPPATAAAIVAQIANALETAHRAGVTHRDVKPSNIIVDAGGTAHLIDFGTAYRADQPALTLDGNVVGTLGYLAPERFDGRADARSDQYSLACVLYECLTGRKTFGDADAAGQVRAHLTQEPPPASTINPVLPTAIDAILARALAKDPRRRWPSAGAFADAAHIAITGRDAPTVDSAVATNPAIPARVRRTPGYSAIALLAPLTEPLVAVTALALLAAAIGAALWFGRPGTLGTDTAPERIPGPESGTAQTTAPEPPLVFDSARPHAEIGRPLPATGPFCPEGGGCPPAFPEPAESIPEPSLSTPHGNGNGNGNGKSDHGNRGQGNGKAGKPEK